MAGIIPCVVFTPDDLRMVKDSADRRRGAIDSVGDQLSPAYLSVRMAYERIVRQRNALLKERLAQRRRAHRPDRAAGGRRSGVHGAPSQALRPRVLEVVRGVRDTGSRRGAHGDIRSVVEQGRRSSVRRRTPLAPCREALSRVAAEEKARGLTLVGPHRDDVVFSVNGREARAFASQGQTANDCAGVEARGGGRYHGYRRSGPRAAAR